MAFPDGSEAVDLGQSPGDIVVLSAADTELASLSAARAQLSGLQGSAYPTLRLANLMQLSHPMSVDLYVESVISQSRMVIARVLGGVGYWSYGVEQIEAICRSRGIPVAFLPGDDQPDAELAARSTVNGVDAHRLWQYCVHGGVDNARGLLGFAATLIGHEFEWLEPRPLPRVGIYWPGEENLDVTGVAKHWKPGAPTAAIVFLIAP